MKDKRLLQNDIEKNKKCVVTGSLCGWGDLFIEKFELVVLLDIPTGERIARIKKREFERFGNRILCGGDMYENHKSFVKWAESYDTADENTRSRAMHRKWIEKISCSVIIINEIKTVDEMLNLITKI